LQGGGYVLGAVGICAPGGPESEWQDQDPPPRGDPASSRRQRGHGPGEGQGIGIVARNRSAALRTPEGRSMKTSRLGLAAGPSHSPSRTHARQVTIPPPNRGMAIGNTGRRQSIVAISTGDSQMPAATSSEMQHSFKWQQVCAWLLRVGLAAAFLSAVADRFGLWGQPGSRGVSWGDMAHFYDYTAEVN